MTNTAALIAKARALQALHIPGQPLVLANVWDIPSARIVQDAGATALATTSSGVSWELGAADGDHLDRDRAVEAVRRIAGAVELPVSADIERGYGELPADVAETVRAILGAGAVGINIEDSVGAGLRPAEEMAERIAAARAAADDAGVPLFVNARTDTYLRQVGEADARLAETLRRAAVYREAGADGIFVPGVVAPGTVKELVDGIEAPLNILAGPGAPDVREFAGLGVARISVGGRIAEAVHGLVRRAAKEVLAGGGYTQMADAMEYGELNELLG
ncbi:isocitrate lyase/phosphoenolpyruvate mutase family protein [Streptomyces sp. TRM66268-LWL]|uniref:Isocitrate lyase/phosphoenolpyruvate mutase family protein n=1 Tax=Streptomyces polyasparticus TaxID=2767826 RepID=A0ABR7SGW0_9ACTN|nr:isocitrate lyase/phosphoenolpyruvate mutase family protein [Streptomyces polyasparticus]MBC9713603.1 isocitrate lyase/phosphoenolpyruvate mutase family protein [Streptomyces polyasparticus]